jgi:hypothetical protein
MQKTPPILDRESYLETCKILLQQEAELNQKYKVYEGPLEQDKLIFVSNTYINDKRAKKSIFEEEEEKLINEHNEIKYYESGEEQKIAQDAGNSRPYTDYFEEFIPNTMEESKRKHKYTVSLHRAISTKETFEMFQ